MANFRRLFIVEGTFLGESPVAAFFAHEELRAPYSYLWFCERCGEVYARSPVISAAGQTSPWQSFASTCRRCPPTSGVYRLPGSLWLNWDKDLLAAFPDAVLRHETLRHLDYFDKVQRS